MDKRIVIGAAAAALVLAPAAAAKNRAPALNKKKVVLRPGGHYRLKVKNRKNRKIRWSTTKKKIASVNKKGVVTARKTGTAKIRAKIGGKTLVCKVTVKNKNTSGSVKKAAPTPGGKATPTPGGKATPTPGGKATPIPGGKATPTPKGDSLAGMPTEDPNNRDDGWVPGWY